MSNKKKKEERRRSSSPRGRPYDAASLRQPQAAIQPNDHPCQRGENPLLSLKIFFLPAHILLPLLPPPLQNHLSTSTAQSRQKAVATLLYPSGRVVGIAPAG